MPCGSRKHPIKDPIKEPFVELMKGSLNTEAPSRERARKERASSGSA